MMTSDDGLAYSITVNTASITKVLVLPPMADLTVVVSLIVACLNAFSV